MNQGNTLLKGFFKLSLGKILSQIISFSMLPVLARLYTPENFGALGLYLSTCSILGIIATLNYDVAITAGEDESECQNTLYGSLLIGTLFVTVILVVVHYLPPFVFTQLGIEVLYPYRHLIPLGVWILACFNSFNMFTLRVQRFGAIAKVGLLQTLVQTATQLLVAATSMKFIGLITADMFKNLFGTVIFAVMDRQSYRRPKLIQIVSTLKKLAQFPKFGLASDLVITLGVALPALFISKVWSEADVGFFLMAQKIYDIPLILLGGPLGRVFLSESIRINQQNPSELLSHFRNTSLKLLILALTTIPVCVFLFYFLAEWLLGPRWGAAGKMAVVFLPLAVGRMVTSPISQISAVIKKQNIEMFASLFRLTIVLGIFAFFYFYEIPIETALLIYSLASLVMYAVFYTIYYYIVLDFHKGSNSAAE